SSIDQFVICPSTSSGPPAFIEGCNLQSAIDERPMKYLPYILKHLRKTWIRTLSSIAASALCIFLSSVLQTALEAFYGGMENASTERRITRHRVSLTEDIPVAYEPRIAAIPGIKRVA